MNAETIGIHASAEQGAAVIKFVPLDQFPADVQKLADDGNIWGAYLNSQGEIVVQDIWSEVHETGLTA